MTIEAMACGTPVVALRAGAVPEIVVDGVTGFVAEDLPGFITALAGVPRIDPAACRAHVARNFSIETMAAGYERAYLTIVDAHRRPASVPAQPLRAEPDLRGTAHASGA